MDNPPAFPFPGVTLQDGRGYATNPGMTLRDWFAGQALNGLIAQTPNRCYPNDFARDAYRIADAMLAARAPKGG